MSTFCRVLVVLLFAVPSFAQLVVTPSNTQGWQLLPGNGAGNNPPPAVYLAPGFETPPLGSGSLHITPGQDGNDNAQARHPGYAGTLLSNLTALSYSTFVEVDGSGGQAPYLILSIDNTGDGVADASLFFEPAYQTGAYPGDPVPNQGALVTDTWQTWNALVGGWWVGTGGPPLVTLANYAAANPTATIVNSGTGLGGVRIVTGFGAGAWDNFLGAADNFTIGVSGVNTTYDFEPAAATVVTVTIPTPDGWTFQVVDDDNNSPDGITTGTIDIVAGPGTPPMGDGSIEFVLGTEGEDGVQARNNLYDSQFIRDLGELTYSTYVQAPGSGGQAPYIILDVDLNNDGMRDDLWFFEPAYQTAGFCPSNPQPALVTGAWQTWDAANGCWYSLFGTAGTGPGVNVAPLSLLLDTEPDARLSTNIAGGSFRIVTGFGDLAWDNFVGNADALTVSFLSTTTTYDFEPVPTITIGDVSQFEGTGGTTNFVFNLTLSEAVTQTVTVDYTTADNTATAADLDYTPVTVAGTATFTPGTTATTITIVVTADNKHELNESFFVNLANPQFATIADPQAEGTIQNDDAQPTISFLSDVALPEGSGGGTTNFPFNVVLSNPSYLPITVNYTTTPVTAPEGVDYSDSTGMLTFVPGDTAEVINVLVNADTDFENDDTFTVDLSAPTNATISDPQALGTIQNDDTQPTISFVADVAQAETNGPTNFVFTVTLSNVSFETVNVGATTNPGTATEGIDYTDFSTILTFLPGDTSETFTVSVIGDTDFEPDETFFVDLVLPINATISDPQALGTILNDDAVPAATINDVAQVETNAGTNFVFTVTLGTTSTETVTINYTTTPGTATEGVDYTDNTGVLTFVPGDTSEQISVVVTGDNVFEGDETFFVDLSVPTNATISDTQGLGTIQNDDTQPTIAFLADVATAEGNAGTTNFVFTVNLSNASFQTVTVNYTTTPGTATEGVDYADNTGTLTFVPGDTSEQITVAVTGDNVFEGDETFFVDLSVPANATISDTQGLGTILNDDPLPQISITDVPQDEGTGATTNFVFTVTLSNPSGSNVTVNYTTNPGTATEGVDYADNTGTVTFLPGDVSETITVVVTADAAFEPNETFFVDLSVPTGATILDNQGLGTIQNDDGPIADVSITKVGPATVRDENVTYTITVSNAGPDTASNVVVTDILPAGTTFVSATPSQGSCSGTTTVTCTLGAIANGGTATITLVITPPAFGTFANTATVANTPELDPTPLNNAGSALTAVDSASIPTLSQWALMALISALMALAVFKLK